MSAAAVIVSIPREARLTAYVVEEHEAKVIGLWVKMKENGDLDRVFHGSITTLTAFLWHFSHECGLVFQDDADGIWFAAWLKPTHPKVVELSVWVRGDRRHTRAALLAMETVCARALKLYSTVIGLSRTELLSMHQRLGYRHVGTIVDNLELFALTREGFKPLFYREA